MQRRIGIEGRAWRSQTQNGAASAGSRRLEAARLIGKAIEAVTYRLRQEEPFFGPSRKNLNG